MISQDVLIALATKYQTTDTNVRREYFQHLFLSYFYQQPKSENILFKGGTALRILYSSPRFSEDLDFNSSFTHYKDIETLLLKTLSQMEKEAIRFTLNEGKPTTGGYIASFAFYGFPRPVELRIEISQREKEKNGNVVAIANDFTPPYNVISVPEKKLVMEKIKALLARKKPRDFYDVYFILRKQIHIADKKSLMHVSKLLQKTTINFEAELKQFLPRSHWAIIRNFKTNLRRELERSL